MYTLFCVFHFPLACAYTPDENRGEELWELHNQANEYAWECYRNELKKISDPNNKEAITAAKEVLKTKYDAYIDRWHSWDDNKLQAGGAIDHVTALGKDAFVCVKKFGESPLINGKYAAGNPFSHVSFKEYRPIIRRMKIERHPDSGYGQKISCGDLTLTIKFGKSDAGEYGVMRPDPNNPKNCNIFITPETLKRHHRVGQTKTLVHEIGHFIEYAKWVDICKGDMKKAYKSYLRRSKQLDEFKRNRELGIKHPKDQPTHVSAYHAEEVFVELFSLEACDLHFGGICQSHVSESQTYAGTHRHLEKTESKDWWHKQLKKDGGVFPPRIKTGRYAQLLAKIKNILRHNKATETGRYRHNQLNYSLQTELVFGGILLGNEAKNDTVKPLAAGITFKNNQPAIEVVCQTDEGTRLFRYEEFDSTDLWVAYHIVKPPQWMQNEYGLEESEHNLVGCNSFENRSEFSLHPALANTSLASHAMDLDTASILDEFTPLVHHKGRWAALQWYDAPAKLEFQNGRIKISPAEGPNNVIVRLRLQGNKAILPNEVISTDKINELVKQSNLCVGQSLFQDSLDKPIQSVYIKPPQYHAGISAGNSALRGRLFKNLFVDHDSVMPKLLEKHECLRRIDRFARLLTLLNWIEDCEVNFPELPRGVKPEIENAETIRRKTEPSKREMIYQAANRFVNRPIPDYGFVRQLKLRISHPRVSPAALFAQTDNQKIVRIDDRTIEIYSTFRDYRFGSGFNNKSDLEMAKFAFRGQLEKISPGSLINNTELAKPFEYKELRKHFSPTNKNRERYLSQIWKPAAPVGDEYLKSTPYVDFKNRDVQQFLSILDNHLIEVGANNQTSLDQWRMALAFEAALSSRINPSFDYLAGTAKASEVARLKEGVCDENAVLLAALLRAKEIPARMVGGLVYAEELQGFMYHAWVEAWIGDRWRSLDSTRPHQFGAAQLLMMEIDDSYPDLTDWQRYYLHDLKIEVVEYSYDEIANELVSQQIDGLFEKTIPKLTKYGARNNIVFTRLAEHLRASANQHLGGSESAIDDYKAGMVIAHQLDLFDQKDFPALWPNYGIDGLDLLNRTVFLRHVCLDSLVPKIKEKYGIDAARQFVAAILAEDPFSDEIVSADEILKRYSLAK